MEIEWWIIRDIKRFGNVSLPVKLCKKNKLQDVEAALTEICGTPVKIKVSKNVRDKCFGTCDTRLFPDTFYIAEMVRS